MALERITHTGSAVTTGLASPINSSVTSLSILSATGWPTGSGGPFVMVIDPGTGSEEKLLCSSISGTTVTVTTRGFDNTTAASHSSGTSNVQHVFSAAEADDDNAHVYTTSRDDHTQYAPVNGARATAVTVYNSSTASVAGTPVIVPYNMVLNDTTGGAFDTSSHEFVCPDAGWYRVHAQASDSTATLSLVIYHNGSAMYYGPAYDVVNAQTSGVVAQIDALSYCAATDTLSIYAFASNSDTLVSSSGVSRASFELVH